MNDNDAVSDLRPTLGAMDEKATATATAAVYADPLTREALLVRWDGVAFTGVPKFVELAEQSYAAHPQTGTEAAGLTLPAVHRA